MHEPIDVNAWAEQARRRQQRALLGITGLLAAAAVAMVLWTGADGSDGPGLGGMLPVDAPSPAPSPAPITAPSPAPIPDPHAGYSAGARRRRVAVFAAAGDDSAFVRKPPPKPGEWLEHFEEPGQTVAEHARSCRNRLTAERHTLHLLPYTDLGPRGTALLPEVEAFVEAYFGVDAAVLPTLEPPAAAWAVDRDQWNAEVIADAQEARVPANSLGVLGLVGGDLYVSGLDFVFGIGRFERRVGVHGLHRFGDDPALSKRRTFALAAHELGHMFGIEHCVFYGCIMNGINSLAESDRTPLHLCPVCREKLRHAVGFEHAARYRGLARFYDRRGMADEAGFVRGLAVPFER